MRYINRSGIWRLAAVITVFLMTQISSMTADRYVEAPSRPVSVIDRVDVVVVGGSEGGMAAAWKAAKLGARVILLNEETFLGSEVTAKGRFDLAGGSAPAQEFSRLLFADMKPSIYRVTADTVLRNAGVVFLHNTRPGGVLTDASGKLCGVVTANKAGLQAVIAKVVIDATYAGSVADEAGARRTQWNVKELTVSRLLCAKDGKKREEIVKNVSMPQLTWPLINKAESLLREEWHYFVRDPFGYSMHFTMPTSIIARKNDDRKEITGPGTIDLGVCEPQGTERLIVLGSSCAVSRDAVRYLMHPVVLAEIGERLGERAVQMAALITLPKAADITVKAPVPAGVAVPEVAISELKEMERPYRKQAPEIINQPKLAVPVWAEYDVVVIGSGPAGHSAAIAAGRAGAKTLMIEQAGFIGGGAALGIKSFWRGYRKGFNQEWWKSGANYSKMLKDAGVDIWYHSLAMGAVKQGNRVAGVEIATWLGRGVVLARVVIDASGEADVCAAAGAESFYLNEGDLCLEEASFIGQNLYTNSVPADPVDVAGYTLHHVIAGQYAGKQHFPMAQIRETRRIKGDYVINELDVNAGRTYHDVIAVSASAFDPHGYYSSDYSFGGLMLSTKHVKTDIITYIPLRAILPAGLEGIMAVGRCHSMTHDVQAAVRMNPDVINEGYAAGYAAAMCVKQGTTPRNVNIKELQDHLTAVDILPADDRARITVDMPDPSDAELVKAAEDPSQRTNLLVLARGGSRSIEPLKKSLAASPATAKALCLLGDPAGIPLLSAWLEKEPLGKGPVYHCYGFLDVPEVDGAMWVLGIPKDKRAVPALINKLRECRSDTGFNKVRAVTMALGRIGDPQAAQALSEFLKQPGIQGHMNVGTDPSTIFSTKFSQAMIELFAASALYRCGDADGLGRKILTDYLDDWRGIFVRYAGNVLAERKPADFK